MKRLLLFDVDGTIAEAGQKMDSEVASILMEIKSNGVYDLGIVGGGEFVKILSQIDGFEGFRHIFSECGCVYYRRERDNEDYRLMIQKNLRNHPLYPSINHLIKVALRFLSEVDYPITGHFIDLRSGIVYISLIGMAATTKERIDFMRCDRERGVRKRFIELLRHEATKMGVGDELCILEGGSVGVGVYPKEYGKDQVIEHLTEYDEIIFLGDKYTQEGNDYPLMIHPRVNGVPVDGVDNTVTYLKRMLSSMNWII